MPFQSYKLLAFKTQVSAIPNGRTYPHLLHTHIQLFFFQTGHEASFTDVILNLLLNFHHSAVGLCESGFVEQG